MSAWVQFALSACVLCWRLHQSDDVLVNGNSSVRIGRTRILKVLRRSEVSSGFNSASGKRRMSTNRQNLINATTFSSKCSFHEDATFGPGTLLRSIVFSGVNEISGVCVGCIYLWTHRLRCDCCDWAWRSLLGYMTGASSCSAPAGRNSALRYCSPTNLQNKRANITWSWFLERFSFFRPCCLAQKNQRFFFSISLLF